MRILVVQESDWIARGPHQSHHLMERLSKRGHEIRVIDYEIMWRQQGKKELISNRQVFENVHKATEDGAVTVIRPPIIKVLALNYISLIYTHHLEIQRQINEFKPDVIIGFGILNSYIAIKLAKKNHIPFIYYIVDELHRLVPENAFREFAKRFECQNMKNADKVISINEALREYTIQMGAAKEYTAVIRAGVDIERFKSENKKSIREKYSIKDRDIVLFFMGWLYPFSGLKEVAFELSKDKYFNIKLLIVGRGDLWNEIQEIKTKHNLDRKIIMIDWVPYNDIPIFLACSDICILPAYNNNIMRNIVPIKLYEYMAAGKLIITTKLPGVMMEFGNIISYVDKPEDVLEKVICLYEEGKIELRRQRVIEFIGRSSWDNLTIEFEALLESIIINGR